MRKFQLGRLRNLLKVNQLDRSRAGTRSQVWAYLYVFCVSRSVYVYFSFCVFVSMLS